jgi:transcriptional regulator with XRE-family HTH domain
MAKAKKKNESSPFELEEILRTLIQESGQSLNAIAMEAGITPAQLSRFVRGDRSLMLGTVSQLAKVLKFTISKV